mgnify:CR=1 FL=1
MSICSSLRFLVAACVALLLSLSLSARDKTDREIDLLRGQVKVASDTTYVVSGVEGGTVRLEVKNYVVSTYDAAGNKKEMVTYRPDGKTAGWVSYTLDSKGYRIEAYYFNAEGEMTTKYLYNNDGDGNPKDISQFGYSGLIQQKEIFSYDSDDNLEEYARYVDNGGGSPTLNSSLSSATLARNKNNLVLLRTYRNDSQGNPLELKEFDNKESLLSRKTFQYDAQGNPLELIEYDGKGNVLGKKVCTYDAHGNTTRVVNFLPDGTIRSTIRTEYQMDATGNWIRKNIFLNDQVAEVHQRNIEYFTP